MWQNQLITLFTYHSWERGPNPPTLWRPPILPPLPFFQICSFYWLVFWLNRWLCLIWCAILLNDIIDLHMLSLDLDTFIFGTRSTLMCVLCNKASCRVTNHLASCRMVTNFWQVSDACPHNSAAPHSETSKWCLQNVKHFYSRYAKI